MSGPVLNIVECRKCGVAYWSAAGHAGAIDGGPCCFGHEVLDVATYPTERAARKAWDAWVKNRNESVGVVAA